MGQCFNCGVGGVFLLALRSCTVLRVTEDKKRPISYHQSAAVVSYLKWFDI